MVLGAVGQRFSASYTLNFLLHLLSYKSVWQFFVSEVLSGQDRQITS